MKKGNRWVLCLLLGLSCAGCGRVALEVSFDWGDKVTERHLPAKKSTGIYGEHAFGTGLFPICPAEISARLSLEQGRVDLAVSAGREEIRDTVRRTR